MEIEKVLKSYVRCRPVIMQSFSFPNNCLQSTRITIEVFQHLGFKAAPLPCRLEIFTQKALELFKEAHELEDKLWDKSGCRRILPQKEREEYERIADEFVENSKNQGARIIDIGSGLPHLVAIVEDKFLVDSSIDQVEKPDHEIIFPEEIFVTEINRAFRRGRIMEKKVRGMLLRYTPKPEQLNCIAEAADWNVTFRPEFRNAIQVILKIIEKGSKMR